MPHCKDFIKEIPDLLRLAVGKMRLGDTATAAWILVQVSDKLEAPQPSTEDKQDPPP